MMFVQKTQTEQKESQTSKVINNILKLSPSDLFMWLRVDTTREYQQSFAVSLKKQMEINRYILDSD